MNEKPANRRSIFAVWHWKWYSWVIVAMLSVATYPISFVPACWTVGRYKTLKAISALGYYKPVASLIAGGPEWYQRWVRSAIRVGMPKDIKVEDDMPGRIGFTMMSIRNESFTYTVLGETPPKTPPKRLSGKGVRGPI